jgi:hypothetical protein
MADEALAPRDEALERLTAEEHIEFDRYCRSGKPDLALSTSLKLYELFVQGLACVDIAKLNPALSLGAILKARIEHRWDERRDIYLAEIYGGANDRLKQIGAESLNFLGLTLAVAHKQYGEKMARYLQTGKPEDLGTFQVQSLHQYKQVIETIRALTGADRPQRPPPGGIPPNSTPVTDVTPVAVHTRPMTPEEADALRRRRLEGKK